MFALQDMKPWDFFSIKLGDRYFTLASGHFTK